MPGSDPINTPLTGATQGDTRTGVGPGRIANPFAAFPNRNQDLSRLIHDRHMKRMMRVVREQPEHPTQRVLALLRVGLRRALR